MLLQNGNNILLCPFLQRMTRWQMQTLKNKKITQSNDSTIISVCHIDRSRQADVDMLF